MAPGKTSRFSKRGSWFETGYTEFAVKKPALLAVGFLIASSTWAQAPTSESGDARLQRELRVPDIIRALGLTPGSRVADIGAGDGLYERALSDAVGGDGRVYAEDISEGSINRLKERIAKEHLQTVETLLG